MSWNTKRGSAIVTLALTLALTLAVAGIAPAETGVATSGLFSLDTGVSAAPDEDSLPRAHRLERVYPNPFNPTVTIEYSLASQARVVMGLYDLRGRLVRTLVDGEMQAMGPSQAVWRGRNNDGQQVSGGVYLCRLRIGDQIFHRRLTLLK